MGLVVDRLSAEQRRVVIEFARRSGAMNARARDALASTIARSVRAHVSGSDAMGDDVEFLVALAGAIATTPERHEDMPARVPSRTAMARDDDVAGRRYLLGRLDDLVAAGAIDHDGARRVREVIAGELSAIAAEREVAWSSTAATPQATTPQDAVVPVAQSSPPSLRIEPPAPAGPSALDELIAGTSKFATAETPSLLLYIGAFLIVVAAFIFVNVSGDQISDLVKLVLMLAGTGGFLAAGIVCHRFPRVLPAGRTFLVIGALIAPLDIVAYYVLVARASPFDAPTLWLIGSFVCASLYASLRFGGYGIGYSYLFYAGVLSTLLALEAMLHVPLAWAAVPVAALALLFEWLCGRRDPLVATLFGPLQRMTVGVAALAVAALLIPANSTRATDRAAIPVDAALLTIYYFVRAPRGAEAERILAVLGPVAVVAGAAYASGANLAALGLVAVLTGAAYLAHELSGAVRDIAATSAPWARRYLTLIGLALLGGGLLPLQAYSSQPAVGALAYVACAATLVALSLSWDDRDGDLAQLPGEALLAAGLVAALTGYRFGLAATGLLPMANTSLPDLARAYAPLSFAAWAAVAPLRRRPAQARVAAIVAAVLSVGVSVGTYPDAAVHTAVNALYAAGAAAAGLLLANRRVLWIAGVAAMLGAVGAHRWAGAEPAWLPLFALAPSLLAASAAYVPPLRALRGTLLQIASAAAVAAAGIGLSAAPFARPWDTAVWRTAMVAIAAAGAFGALEAWRQRSRDVALAAGLAVPVLIDMAVLTLHPTLPEPLTLPFAAYAFVAAAIAARSRFPYLRDARPLLEYAAPMLTIAPTVARASDFGTLIVGILIAFALLAAASRWQLVPMTHVALVALLYLSITRVFVDARLDEIRIAAGAALLAFCAFSLRTRLAFRLPEIGLAELVAAGLILIPTAVVTLIDPGASHLDIPIPLLLCIELAALYAVAVVYERVMLLRVLIGVSVVAGLEFLALSSFGEWYAALLGSVMVNVALAVARRWPNGRSLREHSVLGAVGVAILFLPSLGDTFRAPTFGLVAEVLAGGVGVAVAAALLGEIWITGAALGVIALESLVVMGAPGQFQAPAVLAGAALMAIATAFPRFSRRGLPLVFSSLMDLLGLWLFLLPTVLLTYTRDASLQHAVLMGQLLVLMLAALGLHRRWLVIAAVATLGLETVRAIFEVVNRIPSFATFAISGALLLSIGFLLLLKRELFERWRGQLVRWWTAWLATAS